jgi:hypothetical protein
MYDPLLQTHRELRIALRYAVRELQRITMTPRRIRLLQQSERILRESKAAAVAVGVSKMPVKAWEEPGKSPIDFLSAPLVTQMPPNDDFPENAG